MAQTSTYDNVNSSNAPDLVDNATDMTIPPADSSLTEMQQEVCNILNADTWMQNHGAHFYPENALDIDFQIRNALDKQGLSCVVMTPKMTFQGHAKNYQGIDKNALAVTIDELLVEIVEQPTINRARQTAATALDVAIKAANLLCGLDTDTKNVFNNPRIEQGEANNLLTCQLRTSCTILLD